MSFPDGFVWGAAAASYQIEGGANQDGRGASVWDMMCRKKGAIRSGHTGDVACDHYNRYKEDVALMKEIGLHAYRLSISWPRVLPMGKGAVNEKGLDFYDRLVDELLANGIAPYTTLFHWDFPYELYCQGGWLNADSSDWFAEYTAVVVDKISDRVQHWMTLNEPLCFVGLGHEKGVHAPGDKLGFREVLRIAHNVLLAHGKSIQTIRARSKSESRVGAALNGGVCYPVSEDAADIEAAREAMFRTDKKSIMGFSWFGNPTILGNYPKDGVDLFGADMPEIADGDMATICQPLDFFGLNNYHGNPIRGAQDGRPQSVKRDPGYAETAFDWPVEPKALRWGPRFLWDRYGLPILVTENGLSNVDWVSLDGKVHDPQRIDQLTRYLLEFEKAGADGVELLGYLQWSIMDNFEWSHGYHERFGIIYVDYATQKRTLKDSAHWYRDVIASNGETLSSPS